MISAKAVKTTAKMLLKENWTGAIVIAAAPVLATAVIYIASYLLSLPLGDFSVIISVVLSLFLLSPLWLGALRCYWKAANGVIDAPAQTFYYFSCFRLYKRAVVYTLKIALRIFVAFAVFFLPSIIARLLTTENFYDFFGMATPIWVLSFSPIFYVLRFAGFVLLVAYLLGIMLPAFLFVANEDMSVNDCIKRGIEIGRTQKNSLAAAVWSYMGWILLSLFMVPLLFTLPYLLMSYVVACRFAVAQYNMSIDKMNEIPTHEV